MLVGFYTGWLPSHSRLRTTSCAKVFALCSVTAKVFATGAPNQSLLLIHSLALSHDTMIMKGMGCIFCIIVCILPSWTICKVILPLAQFFCFLLVVKLKYAGNYWMHSIKVFVVSFRFDSIIYSDFFEIPDETSYYLIREKHNIWGKPPV